MARNRAAWDVANHKYVDDPGSLDREALADVEVELLAPLLADRPRVVHLQSGNGTDCVELLHVGAASAVGVDFSVIGVRAATTRASRLGSAAQYTRRTVLASRRRARRSRVAWRSPERVHARRTYGAVMARFHRATITPTKEALIAAWAPTQPWGPSADEPMESIGSYRFDDPDGRVGMETFLVSAGGGLVHVPLTYRDEPLDGGDDAVITEMEHSVLGTRWVYDGLRDPRYVVMLAAFAMTGQGEALGMAVYEDRWYIAPTNVRVVGGGWGLERVPVDRFELVSDGVQGSVLRNDRFELTVFRRPVVASRPPMGLTATWDGQRDPVLLAVVREH